MASLDDVCWHSAKLRETIKTSSGAVRWTGAQRTRVLLRSSARAPRAHIARARIRAHRAHPASPPAR
eukprot:4709959-Alexandrium_andersonii.AAC.1